MNLKFLPFVLLTALIISSCSPERIRLQQTSDQTVEPQTSKTPAPHTPTSTPVSPTATQSPTLHPRFSQEVVDYAVQLVEKRKVPGIAVGLLTPEGMFFYNYGAFTWESDQPVDEHTLFEIGSITKVFTALLLAYAVEEERITLDASIQDAAPEGIRMPAYISQAITFEDLATQRSNLPRMPSNFMPEDTFNPYNDYPREEMYAYLDGYKLTSPPGTHYEYSNLGFMLLGDLLEQLYEQPYEEIVLEKITRPLDIPDTRITLTSEQKSRFARAHNSVYPVPGWDFALPGAGALRSTTTDMLRFLKANLQPGDDSLGAAMQRIRQDCYNTETYFIDICLGLHSYTRFSKTIYWHNGQTGGYHSFAGFVPEDGTAAVVLVNSNYNIDELALHLLDPQAPMPAAP